jgi:hypothetical protein
MEIPPNDGHERESHGRILARGARDPVMRVSYP